MATELTAYWAVQRMANGVISATGSLVRPFATWLTSGKEATHKPLMIPRRTLVAPYPAPTRLWGFTERQDWTALTIEMAGTPRRLGFIHLSMVYDAPVSASDQTPSGAKRRVATWALSCNTPLILNTTVGLVHADPAVANGVDGSGVPLILTDTSSTLGRIYSIDALNLSTTQDVDVVVRIEE